MGYTLVTAVLCLAILRLSEGAAPVVTGGNTQALNMAEDTAAAAAAFTLTSDSPALYTLGGTDGTSSFDVTPTTSGTLGTTATVTIKSAPVFATKTSYSLTVTATNSAAETTAVTVTLGVIKKPAFTATTFTVSPCDGATATTAVTQVTATGHTGRTLTYAIASGNTGTDLSISTTTGLISVAASKTLSKATTATYTLVVTAADTTAPAQTGTTTVTVNILSSSGSAAITGSMAALLCMIFSIIQKLA